MNTHRLASFIARVLALSAFLMLPALSAPIAQAGDPVAALATCADPPANNWKVTGNCATNPPTQFIGTLESKPLVFKTDAAERMRILANGNVGMGTASPTQKLHLRGADSRLRLESTSSAIWTTTEYKTNAREWHTGVGGSTVANDVKSKYYIFDASAGQFRLTIDAGGNVGIGTTAPGAFLSVLKPGGVEPVVQGTQTGLKVGTPGGTIPLALRQNAPESGTPGLAFFETSNGDLGYIGANSATLVVGAAANKALAFNVNGASRAMTIASNGAVGIGTANLGAKVHIKSTGTTAGTNGFLVTNGSGTNSLLVRDDGAVAIGNVIPGAKLHIKTTGTTSSTWGFTVSNGNGNLALSARDDGRVGIGHLGTNTYGWHVCLNDPNTGLLSKCGSAAEYVPAIDGGSGYPETADLVSIAPGVTNPYGDTHGPFAVHKSAVACDSNLMGFIVNPEFGADGIKLNDYYLPLAIFGYFPAKVTLENGAVKRGDPLTSSSKPGYAMKATSACKIIGYALEDANAEGTIQVFSHLSENAASEVVELRKQMDTLAQENLTLKQENVSMKQTLADIQTRLKALEQDAIIAKGAVAQAE